MLHYLYWGSVMPPSAYTTMVSVTHKVSTAVSQALDANSALDLGWLHVEPKTLRGIAPRLRWWLEHGSTAVDVRNMFPDVDT